MIGEVAPSGIKGCDDNDGLIEGCMINHLQMIIEQMIIDLQVICIHQPFGFLILRALSYLPFPFE